MGGGNYNNYDSNNQDEEVNMNVRNADGSYKMADNINSLVQLLANCENVEELVFVLVLSILHMLGLNLS